MGRRAVRFVGERKGNLEILSIIPQNKTGRHVNLELFCHACKSKTTQSSVVFSKSKSCSCQRHKVGLGKTSGDYLYVGIDRLDPHLGYTIGNVVSCCWTCNMMKNNLTPLFFLEHVQKIARHESINNAHTD